VIGVFLRLTWMVLGNVALAISLFPIAQGRPVFFSIADGVFWAMAAAVAAARFADVRFCGGATVSGTPATMEHVRVHATSLAFVAAIAWGLAHIVSMACVL
jgi:hypothetical protein